MERKKFKRPVLSLVFYIISALLVVLSIVKVFTSITYLNTYFKQYGTTLGQNVGDAVQYIVQGSLNFLIYAVIIFIGAKIYDEIKRLNPDNRVAAGENVEAEMTDEEAEPAYTAEGKEFEAAADSAYDAEEADAAEPTEENAAEELGSEMKEQEEEIPEENAEESES